MHDHARHAALGVLVALLAIGALAQQRTGALAYELPRTETARATGSAHARSPLKQGETLDLNTASEAELTRLPGVGPALARRITALRLERGGFAEVRALLDVRGIGPAKLARIERLVRVVPRPQSQNNHVNESVAEK